MKTICLYFQIHQPFRFKRYRFFEIGNNHYYYDDYSNESILRKVANKSYLPANKVLLELFKEYGCQFKVAFSISGTALDQFELYAPDVLESFQKLAKTGCVEFLSETNSHSLVALKSQEEFEKQVKEHDDKIFKLFNKKPVIFRNTELINSNEIGDWVANMGFKGMITEGARHILGWKSPNYVYCSATSPRLKLLLKNYRLSDDIAFRFSDHSWDQFPLTADKFVSWVRNMDQKEENLNLFMNYETFGELQGKETGIFEFLKAFPKEVLSTNTITFSTPSDLVDNLQPVAPLTVIHPISWADEERDTSAWLGNELQQEAFSKLYVLNEKVNCIDDFKIKTDWKYLQTSDHFFYMCTNFFIHGSLHTHSNPFNSPYDAFINYMNILSDFELRVNAAYNAIQEGNGNILKAKSELNTKVVSVKPEKKATTAKKKSVKEIAIIKTASKIKKVAPSNKNLKIKESTKKNTKTKSKIL